MSEFLNYTVALTLRDGSTATGTITFVDPTEIRLAEAGGAARAIGSAQIADLKVLQLPRRKKKAAAPAPAPAPAPPRGLVDDAIVFASPASAPPLAPPLAPPAAALSDDVKQIKALSEFDFAANLAMFDKKSVFADFEKNDTVAPAERLVGHNKAAKFGNDEMVLDPASRRADRWDALDGRGTPLRAATPGAAAAASGAAGAATGAASGARGRLRFVHLERRQAVPLCSPVQLLEIERITAQQFGIDVATTTEVVAVNLALLVLTQILGAGRLGPQNHNLPPLVLLLVGSGRCGARALAVGRHLTNHGVRVLAFVVSADDEGDDHGARLQRAQFERCGGKVVAQDFGQLLEVVRHGLDTPVELIVDALQGYDGHLEDIYFSPQHQRTVALVVAWCNEPLQHIKVMSLDIPLGIDGGLGTVLDLGRIDCRWCVLMGLPITGLAHAYQNGHMAGGGGSSRDGHVLHYMVDAGVPNGVYGRGNLRKFEGVWFSAASAVRLEVEV